MWHKLLVYQFFVLSLICYLNLSHRSNRRYRIHLINYIILESKMYIFPIKNWTTSANWIQPFKKASKSQTLKFNPFTPHLHKLNTFLTPNKYKLTCIYHGRKLIPYIRHEACIAIQFTSRKSPGWGSLETHSFPPPLSRLSDEWTNCSRHPSEDVGLKVDDGDDVRRFHRMCMKICV